MIYELTDEQQGFCYLLGANRSYHNLGVDFNQILAAYSFSSWQNIFFDALQEEDTFVLDFKGKKIKFVLANGDDISVDLFKSAKVESDLVVIFEPIENKKIDFIGYTKSSEMYVWENIDASTDTKMIRLKREDLHKFKEDVG